MEPSRSSASTCVDAAPISSTSFPTRQPSIRAAPLAHPHRGAGALRERQRVYELDRRERSSDYQHERRLGHQPEREWTKCDRDREAETDRIRDRLRTRSAAATLPAHRPYHTAPSFASSHSPSHRHRRAARHPTRMRRQHLQRVRPLGYAGTFRCQTSAP